MSKNISEEWSESQRVEFAKQVKSLRVERGWLQSDLAKAAGVSRQTVSSTENGTRTPQSDLLGRMLKALGVNPGEPEFDENTELWLTMFGTLIEAIPAERRQESVTAAMRELTRGVKGNVGGALETIDLPTKSTDDVQKFLAKNNKLGLAASRGEKHTDQ